MNIVEYSAVCSHLPECEISIHFLTISHYRFDGIRRTSMIKIWYCHSTLLAQQSKDNRSTDLYRCAHTSKLWQPTDLSVVRNVDVCVVVQQCRVPISCFCIYVSHLDRLNGISDNIYVYSHHYLPLSFHLSHSFAAFSSSSASSSSHIFPFHFYIWVFFVSSLGSLLSAITYRLSLLSSCLSILLHARVCSVMGTAMWQQHSVNCCVLRTVLVSNPCTDIRKTECTSDYGMQMEHQQKTMRAMVLFNHCSMCHGMFSPFNTIIRSPICFLLSGFSAFVIVENNLNDTYVWCALTKQKQTHSLRFSPAN